MQRRLRDGATIAFAYDLLNRVSTRTPSGMTATSASYDLLGHPTQLQTGSVTLAYGWDALGRATSEAQPFGTLAYQYDAAGERTRITWPDGFYAAYDYDMAGAVTAIRENGATAGIGVLASYGYDNLGRRTSDSLPRPRNAAQSGAERPRGDARERQRRATGRR